MRDHLFASLRAEQIGVTVHYRPVHLHPYYQEQFKTYPGLCPIAEESASRILSLPIYPAMTEDDVKDIVSILTRCIEDYVKGDLIIS